MGRRWLPLGLMAVGKSKVKNNSIRDIRTSQEPLNYRDNLRAEVSAALANRSRRKRPLLNYSEIPPHSHWMVITIFKSKQRQNRN